MSVVDRSAVTRAYLMPELCHEFQFTLQDILLHCVVLSPERVATVVGNCISETATQCFNFHQVARQSAALVVKTLHTCLFLYVVAPVHRSFVGTVC